MSLATAKPQSAILPGIPAETFLRTLDTLASATKFYPLTFAGIDTTSGLSKKFDGSSATVWFDGVWDIDQVNSFDAAASGTYMQRVSHPVFLRLQVPAGGVVATNVKQPVYAVSGNDYQVSLTPPASGFVEAIGYIEDVISPTVVLISPRYKRQAGAGGGAVSVLSFPLDLASITTAQNVVSAFTPGFGGKIRSMQFVVNKPATTASKAATLSPKINTTAVTGGAVALTSANCTPMGNTVAGSAVTAANAFGATDTITIAASSVTAFAEGSGTLLLTIEANSNS